MYYSVVVLRAHRARVIPYYIEMIEIPLSVLEVLAVEAGRAPSEIIPGIVEVAQTVERLGYRRVWYAEHHSSLALVDFPPAIVIAHVAAVTDTIRVGSGGVLASNHAPLSLAEQFGALASLHPGRIDLGVGRGPGTFNPAAARALRRGADPATDKEYHDDVALLLQYADERQEMSEPWLLASSPAGAALAADLGLPLAFAYHIRPKAAAEALERYREDFRPSKWCESPHVMLSIQAVCAETDAAAAALARPVEIQRASLATQKVDQPLLDVRTAAAHVFTAEEEDIVNETRSYQVQGSPEAVRARLAELAGRFGAGELMLFTPVYDSRDRARSFELIMEKGD
jgi:luciferase family oxidoreductase group 1